MPGRTMPVGGTRLEAPFPRSVLWIGVGFIVWASCFIYRTSFVAIDGARYICLFDDAMVSMRYAWNLSHGMGLVWNPGERVEGYSNLLMTLVMALATLAFDKRTAVLIIQILGVLLTLTAAGLAASIAGRLAPGAGEVEKRLTRILSFLFTLSYYPLTYWSLMGMETGLVTVLLSCGVLSLLKFRLHGRPQYLLTLSGSLGLAYLARPDTALLAAPVPCGLVYEAARPNSKVTARLVAGSIASYALFILAQTIFRSIYYGDVLPDSPQGGMCRML